MSYIDKNGKELKEGDIINLHQTVNGQHIFVVLEISPLDIRYGHNLTYLYQYDKDELLKVDPVTCEVEWEIIDNIYKLMSITPVNTSKTIKKEFKVGDKVKIPKTKSTGYSLQNSIVVREAMKNNQSFLYITKVQDWRFGLNNTLLGTGDWFSLKDLEYYEEDSNILIKKQIYKDLGLDY